MLSLRHIHKRYGEVEAVSDFSLDIPRGAIYGFLGPNGAGKTTAIRSIMNIVPPDEGEILFDGRPMDRGLLDRVGYLPEERGLYRKMKCVEQLAFLAELKSIPRRKAVPLAEQWLERMELGDWKDKKVDALSKGMQQKVQFAATFLFGPDLVILDEPFGGLDPLNIELLRDIIREENARGCTIIFSTHMLAEAEQLCDNICLIEGGRKILDGSLDQIRDDFPLRSVKVVFTDGAAAPAALPDVTQCAPDGDGWRLTLREGADLDALLDRLRAHGSLSLFSANRPSLQEIFLAAVRHQRATAGEGVAS
ncbi:ATP-binding cassette domain-containing protein [bacterium]|nr:ATP-binding cassette domain-containing protein [bacterium]